MIIGDSHPNPSGGLVCGILDAMAPGWRDALTGESERVEWKQSDDADEMLRSTCALANDLGGSGRGGYLLIGIDKHGRAVGTDTSDAAQQRVVSRLSSTRILPTPSLSVVPEELDGKQILV